MGKIETGKERRFLFKFRPLIASSRDKKVGHNSPTRATQQELKLFNDTLVGHYV